MKIASVQMRFVLGDVDHNICRHLESIELAIKAGARVIYFPELSITGYSVDIAKRIDIEEVYQKLEVFQKISDQYDVFIGVGAPSRTSHGVHIAMHWFSKHQPRRCYAKQFLHGDEASYFVPGKAQLTLTIDGYRLVPAICFESLQPAHVCNAVKLGCDVYLASVAESASGLDKAMVHYAQIAKQYRLAVVFANSLGDCGSFFSIGKSTVWNADGQLVEQLDSQEEAIMFFDIKTAQGSSVKLSSS
ncbi:carbon-nitrogen hydrolase family protein [Thalassotalea ganghwensis]